MRVSNILVALGAFGVLALCLACGDDSDGEDGGGCTPELSCESDEKLKQEDCEGCREVDDGCGGTFYCAPDDTCTTPCPDGSFQEFGACDDESCSERMACGELVTCRDTAACLATAECADGGAPMESCGTTPNCLPFFVCGVDMACVTLTQCARDACDPGEVASTQDCGTFDLPCRQLSECGETFSCVCGADTLECPEDMDRNSSPCSGGEICHPVTGCGITFYCHGDSI